MRSAVSLLLAVICVAGASAQSGRQKPSPTPSPRSINGPSVLTASRPIAQKPVPSPNPTPPATPDSEDVIRVDAALVPIPVAVTDADGRPVSTIKLENFLLTIDGKPAEVSELTRSETPISLAMLFDNSSSVLIARDFEVQAAVRFFRRVIRPNRDRAALFSIADYTRLEQPLTSDVSILTRAIERFPPPKGATALLDGIIEAAEYLRSANGRRVIVIVSDGEDTYSDLKTTLEDVIRRLLITDCLVYVVNTKDFENFKRTGRRGGNANTRTLTAERRMMEITEQTGGAVYSPIDDDEMAAAFTRIAAELSQQYVISYYPDNNRDKRGEFRSIDVAVKGKPQYSVSRRQRLLRAQKVTGRLADPD